MALKATNLKKLFGSLVGNYGDDVARAAGTYGDDALRLASNYGDEALVYGLDVAKYAEAQASNFRQDMYSSLTPEQQDAIYLSYMLNPDSDFYEGYVGSGYTVPQYEHLVRNADFLRDRFRENIIN